MLGGFSKVLFMSVNILEQNSKQPVSKRRKSKRKAKSPLSIDSGQVQGGLSTGITSGVSGNFTQQTGVYVDRQVKRIYTDLGASPYLTPIFATNSEMNNLNMTSPIGNFQQPFAFGFPQSTPAPAQGQMFSASPSLPQTSPPAWACQIIEDIRMIKIYTEKIEKTVY